ncbi:MAG TPA: M48 family metallopeptidase [Bryobacteraceae bacterium]|nr:M48 family metallopeptidase [Bryobacteraceae bacterium]
MPHRVHFLQIFALFAVSALTAYPRAEIAPCKNNYSPEQQIALGQKAVQQVYKNMPILPDSSPITQYIQQLGEKLAAQAPGYKWPYNFHVANVADINAFALPGGAIFVNLGTIQAAATEAQLAGVMAHEISHVVLQHSVCNAVKQQKVGLLAGLGQVAAGVLLGGAGGQLAAQGIGMSAGLGFLKMSRGAEKQADLMGTGILYDAGYDPRGMTQFFETIQAKYGEGGSQFMSDHPNPGNRAEYVDKEIATFVPHGNKVENTPAFTRIHSEVAAMHAYTGKEVASGVWRRENPNQTVSSGVNQPANFDGAPSGGHTLRDIDLGTPGAWKTLKGDGYSISLPANWQAIGNKTSAMAAPNGGFSRTADGSYVGVTYGVLIDVYQPQSRMSAGAAFDSLVGAMARDNDGLVPGPQNDISAGEVTGRSAYCENPNANHGQGERDWVVAFGRGNGSLRYFVFVAPTQDFEKLRPTYQKMLESVAIQ